MPVLVPIQKRLTALKKTGYRPIDVANLDIARDYDGFVMPLTFKPEMIVDLVRQRALDPDRHKVAM